MIRGSFWRNDPAAAFRGLANGAFPSATNASLRVRNSSTAKNTSPRTSRTSGTSDPVSSAGIDEIVRTLAVTSSPTRPSPRVAACTNRPRSYTRSRAKPSTLSSQT